MFNTTRFETVDDAIEGHGMDPRTTPIDTLMAGPSAMHFDVADTTMFGEDE